MLHRLSHVLKTQAVQMGLFFPCSYEWFHMTVDELCLYHMFSIFLCIYTSYGFCRILDLEGFLLD